jgi:hypothetical protein
MFDPNGIKADENLLPGMLIGEIPADDEDETGDIVSFTLKGYFLNSVGWRISPNGRDYWGTKSSNVAGAECSSWVGTEFETQVGGAGKHTFCRNPNNLEIGPWCYVNSAVEACFIYNINPENRFLLKTNGKIIAGDIPFNYEEITQLTMIISATDNNPRGALTSISAVNIYINDVNEPPIMLVQTLSCREDHPINSVIGDSLNASDVDKGQTLSMKISDGDPDFIFTINGDFELLLRKTLDYEVQSSYQLEVTVVDSGKGALADKASVFVEVENVNEKPWFPEKVSQ